MLHQDELWAYIEGNEAIEIISDKAHNLYYFSEDKIFFQETVTVEIANRVVKKSAIMMIECLFGSYQTQ